MKIMVLSNYTKSLIRFRKELLANMVLEGHEVIALAPEAAYEEQLKEIGVRFVQMKFDRLGTNPISDIKLLVNLIKIMRKEKPDIYFGYTIKPVVYGSIAAMFAGVRKRFSMVTGLGSLFIDGNNVAMYIKIMARLLYRIGFLCSQKVFFHNEDDIKEMIAKKCIRRKKCLLVNGSGVDLDYYSPSPLPEENIFLFTGSLLRDKGICDYMEAAVLISKRNPGVQCFIVGPLDQRSSSISEMELKHYVEEGSVIYFGQTEDVRPYLDQCRFFVLPSYREGLPRAVLEALAKGRPIITTDTPGCRETVKSGVNGFTVPIRSAEALADKMQWMIDHPEAAEKMAQESLKLAREKYDVKLITKFMLKEMELI